MLQSNFGARKQMMSGTPFKQGDILLVPVPFTDLKDAKQRPALVISNTVRNARVDDLVICGITSNIKDEAYSVMLEQKDLVEGTLHFLSRIKADKLFTIHKAIIIRKLGRVNLIILEQVKEELRKLVE